MDEIANLRHNPRQPWVGATAFAHKGGMHVHAIERVARSYEHINPEAVGNSRRVLVSDMSGRSNILMKAQELGFKLTTDTPELKRHPRTRQGTGKRRATNIEAAEASLALLIREALEDIANCRSRWKPITSPCGATDRNPSAKRRCKVRVGDEVAHTVAEGDGPVNALDGALRRRWRNFSRSCKT